MKNNKPIKIVVTPNVTRPGSTVWLKFRDGSWWRYVNDASQRVQTGHPEDARWALDEVVYSEPEVH